MTKYIYISFIAFLFFSIKINAAVFEVKDVQNIHNIEQYMQLALDDGREVSVVGFENSLSDLLFQNSQERSFELTTNRNYWGKLQFINKLPNASEKLEWVLKISSCWTDMDVFIQQANGAFEQLKSGVLVSHEKKKFIPQIEGNFFKIILPPNEIRSFYFRGKAERGDLEPKYGAGLKYSETYFQDLSARRSSHSFFTGFLFMMFLYNLIFFFINKDRSYLYYSIYLLTLIVYTSYNSGALASIFQPILIPNHPEFMYFGKISIYIGLMAYFAFVRNFLELKALLPNWDKYFSHLFWMGIPWMLIDIGLMFQTNFSYLVGDTITLVYMIIFIFFNIVFIYSLYQTKDKKGYFIIAGILAICFGIVFTTIQWSSSYAFTMLYSKVGAIVEVIAFSLGLAYRQHSNEKSKQAAQFELKKSLLERKQEEEKAIQLKELDQLKTDFHTNITHEFRTPLTVIMGMNQNIKGNQQEQKLIRRNSEKLLQLINQLLDLSKAESGNLTLNNKEGNIVAYLQYLTESFYSMATEKQIRLTFYSELSSLTMPFDEDKIQHIIYNLLSNAIKFSQEEGKVILHVQVIERKGQNHLKIKVKDTGLGIAAEAIPHLFDRYYQSSNTHNNTGTGVGLTLTKELVELMGGKVEVKSIVGTGADFIVYLPIPQSFLIEKKEIKIQNDFPLEENMVVGQKVVTTPVDVIESSKELPLLLIIEDNKDVLTYIQTILEYQYQIHTAKNGEIGIEKAIEIIPDIIISDVMMPIKDGYEVCETLKQDERTSHIPIILLTAKATQDARIAGLKYGADAYLTKPFDREEMMIRLEKLIDIRRILQRRYAQYPITATKAIPPSSNSLEDAFFQNLISIIKKNFDNNQFGVPELAKAANMSQMQMYRKLKALTDGTPSALIRKTRLQKGKELLKESTLTISEIAYDIGFSDPNYFSRTFQKEFGKSPSDYRN